MIFRNKPILMAGKIKGFEYTEKMLKKAKLPDRIPLTVDFNSDDVVGYVENLRWSDRIKGIEGDIVVSERPAHVGYGSETIIEKTIKKRPNEVKRFKLIAVSLTARPVSAKYMLRRVSQSKRWR